MKNLEAKKEQYLATYEKRLVDLYTKEIKKVFLWFAEKYPKRHLRWWSNMGSFGWEVDGKELDCFAFEQDLNHFNVWQNRYEWKALKPHRKALRLMPLWEFYNSISDHTHVPLNWIDIGEFTSEDFKPREVYLLRDQMEKRNTQSVAFVIAWRVVDKDRVDVLQPWFETRREAHEAIEALKYKFMGELK
jgi:hypothetical protein